MKILFILLIVFVGCTSAHKSDHRHPSSEGGIVDHSHGGHKMVTMELPDDPLPLFCDLNDNGTDEDEIKAGQRCELLGGNTAFSKKPILALGLKKGELILTIDDGPTRGLTRRILDLLDKYNIKATFFLTGNRIKSNADIVRRMYRDGHTIGNHTYTHGGTRSKPSPITSESIGREILRAHQTIVDVLGEEPKGRLLFRAPGLAWSTLKARNLNNGSKTRSFIGPIHANLGTDAPAADWSCWSRKRSGTDCADVYYDLINKKKRGIVLTHDLKNKTYDLLVRLFERLDRNGGIRNISANGFWHFKDLQHNQFLNKFDVGSSPAPDTSGSVKVSAFRSGGYSVRSAEKIDSGDYAGSKIMYNGATLITGQIAKYRILRGTFSHPNGRYLFRKLQILEMIDGGELPSPAVVYVERGAF